VGDVHHFFCQFGNFSSLECLKILEFFGRNTVGIVHIALVNDKFRAEFIAHFFFKLFQNVGTYRSGISVPVYIFFSGQFIENQGKLVEEGGVTDNVYMWIVCNKFAQTFHGIFFCLRLTHIKSNLFFKVCPAICHSIVHMYRVPHNVSQETDGVVMKFLCIVNGHVSGFFAVLPLG